MSTLYQINESMRVWLDLYNSEIPDRERVEVEMKLHEIEVARDVKISNCCGYLKNMLSDEDAIETEIKRLKEKKETISNRIEKFKEYIGLSMNDGEKWSNGVHSIGWRASSRIEIEAESEIPAMFVDEKIVQTISNTRIKGAIEAGINVPGARLVKSNNIQVR